MLLGCSLFPGLAEFWYPIQHIVAAHTHQRKGVLMSRKTVRKMWFPYRLSSTTTLGCGFRPASSLICWPPTWLSLSSGAIRMVSCGATQEVPLRTKRTSHEYLCPYTSGSSFLLFNEQRSGKVSASGLSSLVASNP